MWLRISERNEGGKSGVNPRNTEWVAFGGREYGRRDLTAESAKKGLLKKSIFTDFC
jgi:hypothetical protein